MTSEEQKEVIVYHTVIPSTSCPVCNSVWRNYALILRPIDLYSNFNKTGCIYHYVEWIKYLQDQGFDLNQKQGE